MNSLTISTAMRATTNRSLGREDRETTRSLKFYMVLMLGTTQHGQANTIKGHRSSVTDQKFPAGCVCVASGCPEF